MNPGVGYAFPTGPSPGRLPQLKRSAWESLVPRMGVLIHRRSGPGFPTVSLAGIGVHPCIDLLPHMVIDLDLYRIPTGPLSWDGAHKFGPPSTLPL